MRLYLHISTILFFVVLALFILWLFAMILAGYGEVKPTAWAWKIPILALCNLIIAILVNQK